MRLVQRPPAVRVVRHPHERLVSSLYFPASALAAIDCGAGASIANLSAQTWLWIFYWDGAGTGGRAMQKGTGGVGGNRTSVYLGVFPGGDQIEMVHSLSTTNLDRWCDPVMKVGWNYVACVMDPTVSGDVYWGMRPDALIAPSMNGNLGAGTHGDDSSVNLFVGNLDPTIFDISYRGGPIAFAALYDRTMDIHEAAEQLAHPEEMIDPSSCRLFLRLGERQGVQVDWSGNGNHGAPTGGIARRRGPRWLTPRWRGIAKPTSSITLSLGSATAALSAAPVDINPGAISADLATASPGIVASPVTVSLGAVSVDLAAATPSLAAQAFTPSPGAVAADLVAASVTAAASGLGVQPGAITRQLAAAVATFGAAGLTLQPGAVTRALSPAAGSFGAGDLSPNVGGQLVQLGPAGLSASAEPFTLSPGAISLSLAPADVAAAAAALGVSPGAVTRTLAAASISMTSSALTALVGGQAVSLGPATLQFQAEPLTVTVSGIIVALAPATLAMGAATFLTPAIYVTLFPPNIADAPARSWKVDAPDRSWKADAPTRNWKTDA